MAGDLNTRWRESWYFFRTNIRTLLMLVLPVALPFMMWMQWRLLFQAAPPVDGKPVPDAFVTVFSLVFNVIMTCTVLQAVDRLAKGDAFDWRAHWAFGVSRGPRLLLLMALMAIAVAMGLVLLILPGIFLFGRLLMGQVVVVMEDLPALEALKRSFQLSAPNTWEIAAGALGLGVLSSVVSLMVEGVGNLLGDTWLTWVWCGVGQTMALVVGLLVPIFLYRQYSLALGHDQGNAP